MLMSYCRLGRGSLSDDLSADEGLDAINQILTKELLCRHDVKNLEHAYRRIYLAEQDKSKSTRASAGMAIDKIMTKFEELIGKKQVSSNDLISLYHLSQFSSGPSDDQIQYLGIYEVFEKFLLKQSPEIRESAASDLPRCGSLQLFDQDITVLRGSPIRFALEALEKSKKQGDPIVKRKSDLGKLRKGNLQKYPAYLDELLNDGHVHLFDHLIQIIAIERTEHKEFIETLTFSEISHVILEIRKAIIAKVNKAIPSHIKHVLFLIGPTGAGKSTTLCFLRGNKMVLKNDRFITEQDTAHYIGDDMRNSSTFLPNVELIDDLAVVDFPGFNDTKGAIIAMEIELALRALTTSYHPKFLLLIELKSKSEKFGAVVRLAEQLGRILDNKENCFLGSTRYYEDNNYIEIKHIEEKQKEQFFQPTQAENMLQGEISQLERTLTLVPDLVASQIKTTIGEKETKLKQLREERKRQQKNPP